MVQQWISWESELCLLLLLLYLPDCFEFNQKFLHFLSLLIMFGTPGLVTAIYHFSLQLHVFHLLQKCTVLFKSRKHPQRNRSVVGLDGDSLQTNNFLHFHNLNTLSTILRETCYLRIRPSLFAHDHCAQSKNQNVVHCARSEIPVFPSRRILADLTQQTEVSSCGD